MATPLDSTPDYNSSTNDDVEESRLVTDLDRKFAQVDQAVEEAFKEARNWTNFVRKIYNYIESVCKHSAEFHAKQRQLSERMREELRNVEWDHMPLKDYYSEGIIKILEDEKRSYDVFTHHMPSVVGSTMRSRCTEHEDRRKRLKEEWSSEERKWKTAIKNLNAAQAKYNQCCSDLERAKADHSSIIDMMEKLAVTAEPKSDTKSDTKSDKLSAKVDRKRQLMEDCVVRHDAAKVMYQTCVEEANHMTSSLDSKRLEVLAQLRLLIEQSDTLFTQSTVSFFEYKKSVKEFEMQSFQELSARIHNEYKAGSKYIDQVNQQIHFPNRRAAAPIVYMFQEWQSNARLDVPTAQRKQSRHSPGDSPESSGVTLDSDEETAQEEEIISTRSTKVFSASEVFSGVKKKMESIKKTAVGSYSSTNKCMSVDTPDYMASCDIPKKEMHTAVIVLSKCTAEIEDRGITCDGIYRVQAAKTKVTAVCQAFETAESVALCAAVDLSQETPSTLASVLKHYLIQLPEPLLTYELYSGFVEIGREVGPAGASPPVISRLCEQCTRLPYANRLMAATLFYHLQRVAAHSAENKMDCNNLSTVFGPTLLKPRPNVSTRGGTSFQPASINEMVDHQHQCATVGALIQHANIVFGPVESDDLLQLAEELHPKKRSNSNSEAGSIVAYESVRVIPVVSNFATNSHTALSRTQSDSVNQQSGLLVEQRMVRNISGNNVFSPNISSNCEIPKSTVVTSTFSTSSETFVVSTSSSLTPSGNEPIIDKCDHERSTQNIQFQTLPQITGKYIHVGSSPAHIAVAHSSHLPKAFDPDIANEFLNMDEEVDQSSFGSHFHRPIVATMSNPSYQLAHSTSGTKSAPPHSAPPIGPDKIGSDQFGHHRPLAHQLRPTGGQNSANHAQRTTASLQIHPDRGEQSATTVSERIGSSLTPQSGNLNVQLQKSHYLIQRSHSVDQEFSEKFKNSRSLSPRKSLFSRAALTSVSIAGDTKNSHDINVNSSMPSSNAAFTDAALEYIVGKGRE